MIIKSFEANKLNTLKQNFFLFYGENEGFKNQIISNEFENFFKENIYRYEEKEILNNKENFFNNISTKSFFDNERLIIISRATDKIYNIIEEIIEKSISDVKIIINCNILDKKSKLRSFFEKSKNTICIPFYADNIQTLNTLINNFFKEKKISVSQELTNLLIDRSRGDRKNLSNELDKIKSFVKNRKSINIDEVYKLTNLAENYNVSELIDNLLAKNTKKTANILNENNYSSEDCILIVRTLLSKSKRLLKLCQIAKNNKNIDAAISGYKPPIFWKEKEIVKVQINNWTISSIENLIYETNDIELLVKKNYANSISIISDFIINKSIRANN
tara:strand:- start:23 stop:1018 length:996 start_codon:yes stop_codon:yes gene_type:complete